MKNKKFYYIVVIGFFVLLLSVILGVRYLSNNTDKKLTSSLGVGTTNIKSHMEDSISNSDSFEYNEDELKAIKSRIKEKEDELTNILNEKKDIQKRIDEVVNEENELK